MQSVVRLFALSHLLKMTKLMALDYRSVKVIFRPFQGERCGLEGNK